MVRRLRNRFTLGFTDSVYGSVAVHAFILLSVLPRGLRTTPLTFQNRSRGHPESSVGGEASGNHEVPVAVLQRVRKI